MPKACFGAKSYGVGIAPKSVVGWLATVVYVIAMGSVTPLVLGFHRPFWWALVAFGLLTAAFLAIALLKTDHSTWRWRWGDDSSTD